MLAISMPPPAPHLLSPVNSLSPISPENLRGLHPMSSGKRPKLSLKTSDLTPAYSNSGNSRNAIATDATETPTTLNTFVNTFDLTYRPSPVSIAPSSGAHFQQRTTGRPPSPTTKSLDQPYNLNLPFGVQPILKNSPLLRDVRRLSTCSAGSTPRLAGRRVFFPAPKKVAFRAVLEENIVTKEYVMRHVDLSSSEDESNSSDAEKSIEASPDEGGNFVNDRQIRVDEYSSRGRKKRKSRTVSDISTQEIDRGRGKRSRSISAGRTKRKRRRWEWTLETMENTKVASEKDDRDGEGDKRPAVTESQSMGGRDGPDGADQVEQDADGQSDLYFSSDTGIITPNYYYRIDGVERIDLNGRVVAPGYLDLQTNGMNGVHFAQLARDNDSLGDERKLEQVSRMEVSHGVTAWYATVPTVDVSRWKKIVPALKPRTFDMGAELLGAHVEGPFLNPSKRGAHNAAYLREPAQISPSILYGDENLKDTVKLITLAPELPGSTTLIGQLQEEFPHVIISLGHSAATYDEGLAALQLGARALTHVFNAMGPWHHRDPGLAGLIATGKCYFSIIPDGIHLHPSVLTLCMRADPRKCVFITDSIELAGLPDGVYPGHDQISSRQLKQGNKVTIEDTDTLIGSCCTLDECVRNAMAFTGCNLAEAVQCVTENIADMMGESKRGRLESGRRADFVILDQEGQVEETWTSGSKIWSKS
ncbi:N-acetylglucosamine-6-phosphate deacetylase [Rhinocladiella mackenziei CBS 650.93]|uniref:N-acetylglucosamine-6-phosphate deacetylase n=1 Tax=Rhinocladiella mackenziei CBS 650.93 TaxID=1442369 RepID=A0A0D2H7D4_9EURO|nr:N-acetylglucosamine-6-phosphate deacetylase [Rhinocladiella mackenziei CBS 650.93]KIX06318.1 N-acetylglucosamine-6-phosphate deacetylase [Rhinocladiella mackenziei CBS 650.93]